MIAARHLSMFEESPYYALEYVVLDVNMTTNDSITDVVVSYVIRQPELSFEGYGNVDEATGEYEGWLAIDQSFAVIDNGDGTWNCTSN